MMAIAADGSIWLRSSQVSLCIAAATGRRRAGGDYSGSRSHGMAAKAISSPVPVEWYPTLAVVMVSVGLMFTASFFMFFCAICACYGGCSAYGSGRVEADGRKLNGMAMSNLVAMEHIYEATSSRRSRSLAKEIATAAVASVFLGFGSLFVLLASGVYV